MLEFLSKYPGSIKINGTKINSVDFEKILSNMEGEVEIRLIPKNSVDMQQSNSVEDVQVSFYVRPWMLEKSSDDFTFMRMWNNDIPMPLRSMCGTIEKETPRMYYVKLNGKAEKRITCARCGRTLLNPVSKLIGIGPECAGKLGLDINLFLQNNEEKLCQAARTIKEVSWEGWIPKTAVLELKELKNT